MIRINPEKDKEIKNICELNIKHIRSFYKETKNRLSFEEMEQLDKIIYDIQKILNILENN